MSAPRQIPRKVGFTEAMARLDEAHGSRSVSVFRHGTLELKLYAPRGTDPQKPHARDEVYLVAAGSGMYVHGDQRDPFGPGDFLFAPAGLEHRFEDFTEDLYVWVLFYGPEGGEAGESRGKR